MFVKLFWFPTLLMLLVLKSFAVFASDQKNHPQYNPTTPLDDLLENFFPEIRSYLTKEHCRINDSNTEDYSHIMKRSYQYSKLKDNQQATVKLLFQIRANPLQSLLKSLQSNLLSPNNLKSLKLFIGSISLSISSKRANTKILDQLLTNLEKLAQLLTSPLYFMKSKIISDYFQIYQKLLDTASPDYLIELVKILIEELEVEDHPADQFFAEDTEAKEAPPSTNPLTAQEKKVSTLIDIKNHELVTNLTTQDIGSISLVLPAIADKCNYIPSSDDTSKELKYQQVNNLMLYQSDRMIILIDKSIKDDSEHRSKYFPKSRRFMMSKESHIPKLGKSIMVIFNSVQKNFYLLRLDQRYEWWNQETYQLATENKHPWCSYISSNAFEWDIVETDTKKECLVILAEVSEDLRMTCKNGKVQEGPNWVVFDYKSILCPVAEVETWLYCVRFSSKIDNFLILYFNGERKKDDDKHKGQGRLGSFYKCIAKIVEVNDDQL